MEESECMVCFSRFDDDEYRPRFMPCGHTMCSKCLEKAIREDSKMCPKCRTNFSASNLKELPVNFLLESLLKSMSISKCAKKDILSESVEHTMSEKQGSTEADKLPECIEHQLPVSKRCSTHKSWICKSCLIDEHSPGLCKIITITEELNCKKERQSSQSNLLLNTFEESCYKSDDCKKQCKKLIEENDEEILRYETMVKILQETIQKKKTRKTQMENNYSIFENKFETIKEKRSSYDQAVTTLMSSKSIRGVSKCSMDVQNEAKKLQLISREIENDVDQMKEAFKVTVEPRFEFYLGNHKLSLRDGMNHLHAGHGNISLKTPSTNFNFTDEDAPLVTDGTLTFIDLAFPGQESRRIYMRMLGNTARAKQHLLLATGQCGYSYKGLHFYSVCQPGEPGEDIILQPYDGDKAKQLVKNLKATDVTSHKRTAGIIHGAGWGEDLENALFGVYLRNDHKSIDNSGFGIVSSGLEILKEIAKSDDRENIKVIDCGVVFFWRKLGFCEN